MVIAKEQKIKPHIIVGLSGASGVIYGIRLLEACRELACCHVHLICTKQAKQNIQLETNYTIEQVNELADYVYDNENLASSVASGSFPIDGMVVLPCSIKTLSAIAHSYTNSLLIRAADVCRKERRKLILAPREMPLHTGHLENMLRLSRDNCIIMPPSPGFYHMPTSIDDLLNHVVGKVLDLFHFEHNLYQRWKTK